MNRASTRGSETVFLMSTVLLLTTFLVSCGTGIDPTSTTEAADGGQPLNRSAQSPARAHYNEKGELLRPENHREWIFVGAPVTPNDMNDGHAAFPEFHNVYIDPGSFASYKQTGEFPSGTMIVKELVSVGAKSMPSGNGYFQGEFVSLEAMVKDGQRFKEEPGGWAFFRFGEAPNYNTIGARMKTANCNACHSGAGEDYVFTDTYPILRAAHRRAMGK